MNVHLADLVTIGLLIVLEGLLSADNALVMAVIVVGLPRPLRKKALHYGLVGAFAFRIAVTVLAVYLIRLTWVKMAGGLYLLYLTYAHFFTGEDAEARRAPKPATPWLGLSALWATIVRVELLNLAFSVDSILVAVAMSPKLWVILTGGILGIVAMRLVVGRILVLIEQYPPLVDGAFVIIAWVGIKLVFEYLYAVGWVYFEIPRWLSLGLIGVIFGIALIYAKMTTPVEPTGATKKAEALLTDESQR